MNVSVSECLVRIYVDRSDVVCGAVVKPSVPHARLDEITSCQSVIERVALRAQITVVRPWTGDSLAIAALRPPWWRHSVLLEVAAWRSNHCKASAAACLHLHLTDASP